MTTWLVAATGSDANGGTSKVVRSSGADAIVNATAGTTKITSITAAWTGADVGHGINVAGKFRLISAITAGTTFAATTTNSSTTITSGSFTAAMIGQAITGPGIQTNAVITAVSVGVSATMSIAAGVGFGTGTVTLYAMATTTGNVAFTAGTAQAWAVGGMWGSWGNSFLTTNSPIVNGDTVYVGPGIYRESPTANLTSPTATVNIVGDVDGVQTGTAAGEVRLTAFAQTPYKATADASALTMNAKNFFAFSNIVFVSAGTSLLTLTSVGTDTSFTDCAFFGVALISKAVTVNIASNLTFDRCYIMCNGGTVFNLSFPTSTVADYDVNIIIRNCIMYSTGSPATSIAATGANSFKGGGLHMRGCTIYGCTNALLTNSANLSTTIPCSVKDSLVFSVGTVFQSSTLGQIVEDYNIIMTTGTLRSQVTAGAHSTGTIYQQEILPHFGQERIWGGVTRPALTLVQDSMALGWGSSSTAGNDTALTVDIRNRPRPAGTARVITSGTMTSGGTATATDTTASFGNGGQFNGLTLAITGGTGSGQTMMIKSHTGTVLTVFGSWNTQPDNTSTYSIYAGSSSFYGKSTANSGSSTVLTQANATWDVNMWTGFTCEIVSGTGSGEITTVTSNTATALTCAQFSPATPDTTSIYKLYRKTSEVASLSAAGALERHDTATKETTLTDAGGVAWNLYGWSDQEILIPVTSASTTITVKCSFDTLHGNTNKPQIVLLADGEIGVTAQTVTATGTAGSGTFETLSFSAFTPTGNSYVVVRLISRSDSLRGRAVFDTVSVS